MNKFVLNIVIVFLLVVLLTGCVSRGHSSGGVTFRPPNPSHGYGNNQYQPPPRRIVFDVRQYRQPPPPRRIVYDVRQYRRH